MKVLVTGGGGYIGSILVQMLLEKGYKVKCLDRFFFGMETLSNVLGDPNLEIVKDDIRWFDPNILRDVDTVMDLAALSNDPAGELDPRKTMEINYKGRVRVATLSKKYQVERYILASSCSVYGFQDGVVDERSPINPLTTYAKANALAEEETLPLADDSFSVTVLRQATVYGLSPRMRFDLAINGMVLGFYKHGKIPIMRDGTQWRPFVHIRDTAGAFIKVLESERDLVNKEVFNVGSNEQNYQIKPLAELIAEAIGLPFNFEWYGSPDNRSYRVDFSKIRDVLGFKPKYTPKEGAREIYDALVEGRVKDSIKTRTVDWYKFLIEAQKIVKEVELRGVIL
ncbi:NAD(P)-dependent oxidoreductase [Methanothermococcus sp. SCGC AD-155-E23]|nr:NAD(P)-dependent oxidoreductase [Methanothermococcus sp. SCGC AD-155-E23]